jgi:hypothetical protein
MKRRDFINGVFIRDDIPDSVPVAHELMDGHRFSDAEAKHLMEVCGMPECQPSGC